MHHSACPQLCCSASNAAHPQRWCEGSREEARSEQGAQKFIQEMKPSRAILKAAAPHAAPTLDGPQSEGFIDGLESQAFCFLLNTLLPPTIHSHRDE